MSLRMFILGCITPAFGAGARSAEVPARETGEQHALVRLLTD